MRDPSGWTRVAIALAPAPGAAGVPTIDAIEVWTAAANTAGSGWSGGGGAPAGSAGSGWQVG